MSLTADQYRNRRTAWGALGFAVVFHAILLAVMGLARPHFAAPPIDQTPDIQLEITRPLVKLPTRTAAAPPPVSAKVVDRPEASPRAAPATPPSPSPSPSIPSTPSAVPSVAEIAGADITPPPGCAQEDLILLTDKEKAHCRAEMDILKARRDAAMAEAERAARMAAIKRAPKIDAIDPEKRAEYDAAVAGKAANQANAEAFASGTGGQIAHCTVRLGRGGYIPPGAKKVGPFACTP